MVLAIDQGEELFLTDGASESAALFTLLRDLLVNGDPALLVVITIRSDAYEQLQTAKSLEGINQQTLSLTPMPRGAYQAVIEGPAHRLKETDRPLEIEPALTQALLSDIEEGGGRDALPLLAFTLERLYLEYGGRGRLTLKDYDALGRIKGSIEAAIERAFRAADADARIPRDRDARLALLRCGLIPWLAGIDPDTGSPRRQKARLSEIPEEARPLIDLLVEQRLLSTDIDVTSGERTIEPAHESLLRQWGSLQGWLQEDFVALTNLETVKRAARDWDANARGDDWLAHRAARLEEAERLLQRFDLADHTALDDFRRQLGEIGVSYLLCCRGRENIDRRKMKQSFYLKVAGFVSLGILVLIAVLGGPWAYSEFNRQRIADSEAARTDLRGEIFAFAAANGSVAMDSAEGFKTSPYTTSLLEKLAQKQKSLIEALQDVNQRVLTFTQGQQRPLLSTSMNGQIYLWHQSQKRKTTGIVISNDEPGGIIPKLAAPLHDGDGIATLLREANFEEIVRLHNSTRTEIEASLDRLCKATHSSRETIVLPVTLALTEYEMVEDSLAFFFYSGHGLQLEGENFIIPTGRYESENQLRQSAINVEFIRNQLSKCFGATIVILDTHFPSIDLQRALGRSR